MLSLLHCNKVLCSHIHYVSDYFFNNRVLTGLLRQSLKWMPSGEGVQLASFPSEALAVPPISVLVPSHSDPGKECLDSSWKSKKDLETWHTQVENMESSHVGTGALTLGFCSWVLTSHSFPSRPSWSWSVQPCLSHVNNPRCLPSNPCFACWSGFLSVATKKETPNWHWWLLHTVDT